jgi:hypothetical protein
VSLWRVEIQSRYGRDEAKGGKRRPDHKLRHQPRGPRLAAA